MASTVERRSSGENASVVERHMKSVAIGDLIIILTEYMTQKKLVRHAHPTRTVPSGRSRARFENRSFAVAVRKPNCINSN